MFDPHTLGSFEIAAKNDEIKENALSHVSDAGVAQI